MYVLIYIPIPKNYNQCKSYKVTFLPSCISTSWLEQGLWLRKNAEFWVIPHPRASVFYPAGKRSTQAGSNKGTQADHLKLLSFKTTIPTPFWIPDIAFVFLSAAYRIFGILTCRPRDLGPNTERLKRHLHEPLDCFFLHFTGD